MLKKIFSLIMVLALAINIVACSSKDVSSDDTVTITFSWWGNEDRYDKTMEAIKSFEKENPNIKVNVVTGEWTGFTQRMNILILGNNEPDLMQLNYDWLEKYSKDGSGFYDLSKLSEILDLKQYSDTLLQYGTKNGVLNGIPISMNSKVFFYNKNIADKYGIESFNTWNSLLESRNVVTDEKEYPLELNAEHAWILSIAYVEEKTGREFIKDDGTLGFSKQDIADLLSFYKQLLDNKVVPLPNEIKDTKLTANASVAGMTWESDSSKVEESMSNVKSETRIEEIPSESGSGNIKFVKPGMLYGISKNTDHPEEAAKLMKYLLTNEEAVKIQGDIRSIPANETAKSILEKDGQLKGPQYDFQKKKSTAKEVLISPYYENTLMKKVYLDAINSVAYNNQSIEACADTTYTELIKTLESIRS